MIFDLPHSGFENRRSEIRLHHLKPEKGWIRIVCLEGRSVELGQGRIEIHDISPEGCGFRSQLRFPLTPHLLLQVEYMVSGEPLEFLGQLRWRESSENGYQYGMRFALSREERVRIRQVLNRLILQTCPGQSKIHALYRTGIRRKDNHRGWIG